MTGSGPLLIVMRDREVGVPGFHTDGSDRVARMG